MNSRPRLIALVLVSSLAACSATKGPTRPETEAVGAGSEGAVASSVAASNGDDGKQATAQSRDTGPPTEESCRALAVPQGRDCRWLLVPSHYCGGPAPTEEMLWPRCSCERCAQDTDCPKGERCVELPTDQECGVTTHACVGPESACRADGDCVTGERCMWIEARATCKVPTVYLPRP